MLTQETIDDLTEFAEKVLEEWDAEDAAQALPVGQSSNDKVPFVASAGASAEGSYQEGKLE